MNKAAPKVGFGLPVYNGERFLRVAIESVLAQTFTDFELIISDNASTDSTQEIVRDFARRDPRIRYVRNTHNIGVAQNFNQAFTQSTAPYFRWIAHDDYLEPQWLAACVRILDERPEVVLAHTYVNRVDRNGQIFGKKPMEFRVRHERPSERFAAVVRDREGSGVWGLMRSDVLRTTPLHGSYPGSDTVFVAEMALRGRFAFHEEYLFNLREHDFRHTGRAMTPEEEWEWWGQTRFRSRFLIAPRVYYHMRQAIRRANLSAGERMSCYRHLGACVRGYMGATSLRILNRLRGRVVNAPDPNNQGSSMSVQKSNA